MTLCGLLLAFPPSAQAIDVAPSYQAVISASQKIAYAVGFYSIFRFFSRKPDNKPNRYNIEELLAGQNVANNLYYLYDDGLIGHQKESSVLKANPENDNKLEFTESVPARGLFGNAISYAKPIAIAYCFMELLRTGVEFKAKGSNSALEKNFGDYAEKLRGEAVKPLLAFIGAFVAAKTLSN